MLGGWKPLTNILEVGLVQIPNLFFTSILDSGAFVQVGNGHTIGNRCFHPSAVNRTEINFNDQTGNNSNITS